ncbi:LOW QUALITY PROTEIN: sorting nexin-2-like [Sarcophilus harrisii]
MNAYVTYRITTKTSLSMFNDNEFSIKRRFSNFIGLHSKLAAKHLHDVYIVPPTPEKSRYMTKVKIGKEDSSIIEFRKRRASLERYLQCTIKHSMLLKDPELRQFLESSELSKAFNTQVLSGAGRLRMVIKVADVVNKVSIRMNELYPLHKEHEEKQQQFENLNQQLRKLHALVCYRKEISANITAFKSGAILGNSEDHSALSQIVEIEKKVGQLHQEQAHNFLVIIFILLPQ